MPKPDHKVRLEWAMQLVRLRGEVCMLLKERCQLMDWCRLTDRVELKKALRTEIAKIDEELRQPKKFISINPAHWKRNR